MRRDPAQLEFAMPPQRRGGERRGAALHRAVLRLRRDGHRVYRGDDAHCVVDGRRVAAVRLIAAERQGERGE